MIPSMSPTAADAPPAAPVLTRGPPEPPSATRRVVAATLAIAAGVLAGVSAFTSWWTLYISTSSAILSFRPGGDLYIYSTSSAASVTLPYAAIGFGPIEGLYESIWALAIGLLVLGAILGGLMLVSALGRLRGPGTHKILRNVAVFAVIVSVLLVAVGPSLQPTLAGRSSKSLLDFCTVSNTSENPCKSYWGSGNSSGGGVTWGADVGWYLGLTAALLFFVSFLLWLPRRPKLLLLPPAAAQAPAPMAP